MKKFASLIVLASTAFSIVSCKPQEQGPSEAELAQQLREAKTAANAKIMELTAGKENSYDEEAWKLIEEICTYGAKFVDNSTTVQSVIDALEVVTDSLSDVFAENVPLANGAYSYVASSYEERTKILGALEAYAVKYGLTGMTMYSTKGLALYNEGVQLGTQNYIVGYGFGAIAEGGITKGLNYEGMNPAYAKYYHSFLAEDPGHANYGDDKGSVVGDLQPNFGGSFFGNKMNETKDGYEWYTDLALEKPQADYAAGSAEEALYQKTGLSKGWKFNVRTGSQLKYNTLTSVESLKKYNNREVQPEDYITPYKMLLTQANGWARATDNHGSSSELKGEVSYFEASADGFNAEAWKNVGVKIDDLDNDGVYTFHIEFVSPCNSFYAMYQSNSSIYAPIPQEFIDEIGGPDYYCKFDSSKGYSPVDTTLSTSVFTLEKWVNDSEIVFKKNPNYTRDEGRYNVEGQHMAILKAVNNDPEAAFKEFMAGKLSACGVPSTQLENFKGKTEGISTIDSSVKYYIKETFAGDTWKLNFNTLDQETWIKLFGEEGSVAQTAEEDYWECEPIMHDHNFFLGLSYALDRKTFADQLGDAPSVDYFGQTYLSNPEEGIAYNATEEHQAAIQTLIADADHDGFDLELARSYFKKACDDLLAKGVYEEGEVIHIEIAWQTPSNETLYHNFIKKCFEEAFNDPSVCGGKLTLSVDFWCGAVWSDVYYEKMMLGQFDIGFGSISGNDLNPLNFLEVLKSDNSSGFTLNWGTDTSVISEDLMWDGVAWSFDALYEAADKGGYFERSVPAKLLKPEVTEVVVNADGSQTITVDLHIPQAEGVEVTATKSFIYAYFGAGTYDEDQIELTQNGSIATLKVSKELCEKYSQNLYDGGLPEYAGNYHAFDLYYKTTVLDIPSDEICFTIKPTENGVVPYIKLDK